MSNFHCFYGGEDGFQQKSFDITNNQEFLHGSTPPGFVLASSYPGSNERNM